MNLGNTLATRDGGQVRMIRARRVARPRRRLLDVLTFGTAFLAALIQ